MRLPDMQGVLWGVTFTGEVALCAVLAIKGRWREFPAFTTLFAYHVVAETLTFAAYRWGSPERQHLAYWSYVIGDFLLQLAVVLEIARIVLRPTGTWVHDARAQFISWAGAGSIVALVCAWMVTPPTHSFLNSLELRGNLFTSLLVLELFVAMSLAANRLGLGWQNHVMAIAQGLTFFMVVSSVVDSLHAYMGDVQDYDSIDTARGLASVAMFIYWIVKLWQPEPRRLPIAPELQRYIEQLHERVRTDLASIP